MSQKAICPRGHIWDPSVLEGLPATETPRCPICGEEEPLRARNFIGRVSRWARANPLAACLSVLCLLLLLVGGTAFVQARRQMQTARQAAEKSEFEAEQAKAKLQSTLRAKETEDERRHKRENEIQELKWANREKGFQAQLRAADKAARDVRIERDKQIGKRIEAEEAKTVALEASRDANLRRKETAHHLIEMHVAAGIRRMEAGDLSGSLPSFVSALRMAEKEGLPKKTHLLRLAAVLAQCPRPMQLWTFDKPLNIVQLSAEGKRALTVSANGAAEVWETQTGKRVGEAMAHAESVAHAALSPDGKLLLTASADGMLHLWDVATSKETVNAVQMMGPVAGLAFSRDGKRFLVVTDKASQGTMGATEVELRVFDAATAKPVRMDSLGSDLRPIPAVFSPDGKSILTACQDRCARLWDIDSGKQIGVAFSHEAEVIQASLSPDGDRVMTLGADGTARVWRTKTGEALMPSLAHGLGLRGASFSPSGDLIVTFGNEEARVWDIRNGLQVGQRLQHDETVIDARFSPDGRYVLTTCTDGAARLWDYRTGKLALPPLWNGEAIHYAAFAPQGDAVLIAVGQTIRLWDLTNGESLAPNRSSPSSSTDGLTVFSPDGKRKLRATEAAVRIYDTATNETVGSTLPHPHKVTAAAFSADGKRVLTVSHARNGDESEGHLRIWATATGELLGQPLIHARAVLEASFSPDGRRVLTACQDGKARLWDVEKNALVGEPMEHKSDLARALFLSDGKKILTLDVEGGLHLWDAESAEAIGPVWGHRKPIHHLAFSSDGRLLLTSCEDGTARVWEANTGREIAVAEVRGVPVLFAAFSPDAKRFVTVGGDRRARIWDAGNGKPIGAPMKHRAALLLAAFSDDGDCLATLAVDGLRVWDIESGEPVAPLVHVDAVPEAIRKLSLDRDRTLTLTIGSSGDPAMRLRLGFGVEKRSVAELKSLAETLSSVRTANGGASQPLERAELSKQWREVKAKFAEQFSPSPLRAAAWHVRGAAECESRQLWNGLLLHLNYLISAKPSVDLYARRGRAHAELRHGEAAKSDYAKALAGDAGRWDLWAGRAEVETRMGHWDEAIADYSKAIERQGNRAALWTARGRIEAQRGQWSKASADLAKAIHLGEEDVAVWCQYTRALLASGDEANHRRWCARLVHRFGDDKSETTTQKVVWACALAEGAVRDWKSLPMRVERSAAEHPQSIELTSLLAVLSYRTGQFEKCLNLSKKTTRSSEPAPQARDWLLLAMSAHRLGHGDEAKQGLAKAEEILSKEQSDKETWEDRQIYQTLHREAESLIKGKKP
jgi:WD40 repeat protein/tetratricopeptide (TPR) repeat protein